MSRGTEMLAIARDDSLERLYRNILQFEEEKTLPEGSIIRSLIEEYYDDKPSFFMMSYLAFSRDVLFEIVKRFYNR